jgi:hypothetical protein
MKVSGNLKKMSSSHENVVLYTLDLNNQPVIMNNLLGRKISIDYTGEINCIKCGRKTNKSFAQGFCYPCFKSAPETEECVLRPELCQAHEGIARDMEYASSHCLIDHYVYLSLTSNIKVGVTRHHQIPTRWIDQGATEAIIIAKTPNRYMAGVIEVELKKHMADKTNWRNMLTGKTTHLKSLLTTKKEILPLIEDKFHNLFVINNDITTITYPLNETPTKVSSINLDKNPFVEGVLTGIKGQYIILDNYNVLNIRKYGGYHIQLSF